MELSSIHSFLIHPGKNLDEPPEISGTVVAKAGRLFDMMKKVFDKAEEECQHDVAFSADGDGKQHNECRNAILAYLKKCDLIHGKHLAERLQAVTTNRSGLGLLFLMMGSQKGRRRSSSPGSPLTAAFLPRRWNRDSRLSSSNASS